LKAKENRIVMSEKFYIKVKNDIINLSIDPNSTCVKHISEKYIEDFKGVPHPTELRILDV